MLGFIAISEASIADVPVFVRGDAATAISAPTVSGSGVSYTVGGVAGAAAIVAPGISVSSSGDVLRPPDSGSFSIGGPALSALGVAGSEGNASLAIAAPVSSGLGTFVPVPIAGSGSVTISGISASSSGSFVPAPVSGSGDLVAVPGPSVSGAGVRVSASGSGSLAIGAPSASGVTTFTPYVSGSELPRPPRFNTLYTRGRWHPSSRALYAKQKLP